MPLATVLRRGSFTPKDIVDAKITTTVVDEGSPRSNCYRVEALHHLVRAGSAWPYRFTKAPYGWNPRDGFEALNGLEAHGLATRRDVGKRTIYYPTPDARDAAKEYQPVHSQPTRINEAYTVFQGSVSLIEIQTNGVQHPLPVTLPKGALITPNADSELEALSPGTSILKRIGSQLYVRKR